MSFNLGNVTRTSMAAAAATSRSSADDADLESYIDALRPGYLDPYAEDAAFSFKVDLEAGEKPYSHRAPLFRAYTVLNKEHGGRYSEHALQLTMSGKTGLVTVWIDPEATKPKGYTILTPEQKAERYERAKARREERKAAGEEVDDADDQIDDVAGDDDEEDETPAPSSIANRRVRKSS